MGLFISGLSSSYLQSALGKVLESSGLTSNAAASRPSGSSSTSGAAPVSQTPEASQLSPFAELLNTLQQLHQSNPAQYQKVTQQIAANLTNAAQTAQSSGHTAAAGVLNQLAGDFSNASQNNQLPSIPDLAKAVHFHRHHAHPSADADTTTSANSGSGGASNSSANQIGQLLSAFQADGSQNDSMNPMSIIMNTLSAAGIGTSNG